MQLALWIDLPGAITLGFEDAVQLAVAVVEEEDGHPAISCRVKVRAPLRVLYLVCSKLGYQDMSTEHWRFSSTTS